MLNRRTFVAGGLAAGVGGGAWLGTSQAWAARFIRGRFDEIGRDIPAAPLKPAPGTWSDNAVTLAWLGHASVLINFYGVRILTDPTLFRRIGVDLGLGTLGPLRLVQCALSADELPDIDLVLVTHAHFDHLDTPSLAAVRGNPAAVMAASTSDLLPRRAYSSVRELRWDESAKVTTPRGDVLVRSIQVQHWAPASAATPGAATRASSSSAKAEAADRRRHGTDTALPRTQEPWAVRRRVMPIGAYDPWIRNHCTPEQALQMADAAGARLFVPVHHRVVRTEPRTVHAADRTGRRRRWRRRRPPRHPRDWPDGRHSGLNRFLLHMWPQVAIFAP